MGNSDVDAPGYFSALRRGWRTILLGLVLGGLAGWLAVHYATPVYTTDTRFFIATSTSENTNAAYEGNLFSQQRVTSYAEVITDQKLLDAVRRDVGLPLTTQQLAGEVSATVVPNTVILDVTVQDSSPTRAVAIA